MEILKIENHPVFYDDIAIAKETWSDKNINIHNITPMNFFINLLLL